MIRKFFITLIISISILLLSTEGIFAQGDGPKAFLLAPTGLWGVDAKWLSLSQNIVPSGNVFVKSADLKINVFPISAFHTLNIAGRYSLLQVLIAPGNVEGTADLSAFGYGVKSISNSGLADGLIGFRIGLIGAPALNVPDFVKKEPEFSMFGMFRIWYSGTYDASNLISMGTNRWTFEIGLPMAIPFGGDKKMPFWWETVPSIEFYTTNDDPAFPSGNANESTQKPLINLENHITKNITPELWLGVDFRYQYGGTTIVDDSLDLDSKLSIFGLGVSAGYQVLPYLSLKATYGNVIWGYNGADSRMFRLSATFTYVDIEKLK